MRVRSTAVAVLATAVCLTADVSPVQSRSARQEEPPPRPRTFSTGTAAVLVDVVVRDRRGRPVTDLKPGDFELYEDGVLQKIAAVSSVLPGRVAQTSRGRSDVTAVAKPPDAPPTPPPEAPAVVALVFDRLSPEGRALAHQGAQAYLGASRGSELAGVFLIDQSLETIAPFTVDRERIRTALDEVAIRATSVFGADGGRSKTAAGGDTHSGLPVTAGAEHHGPPIGATAANPDPTMKAPGTDPSVPDTVENRIRYLQNRLATTAERFYRMMMHEQQGRATAAGLLAIVEALGALEGRKTVVFFAESLLIPPAIESAFQAVIAAANRANVSIYSVDAAGLRVQSQAAQTATQINALGAVGVGDIRGFNVQTDAAGALPGQQGERGDRAWTKDLELNEDILRQDPAASLGMLARHTGGFLINNTNDLESGFRQIEDDRRFHYLLAYSPANDEFKGEYRRVEVKVRRRGVSVRARTGYIASHASGGVPVLEYERPAIAALERTPLPRDVAVRGRAFAFPEADGGVQVALFVTTESNTIAFELDELTRMVRGEFTILAQIRNAQGEVVRKASQPYRMDLPAGEASTMLEGELLFFRRTPLPPGNYTLEYAVHDARGGRSGAARTPFSVAAPAGGLQLSSIIVIRQVEKGATRGDSDDPLSYDGLTLHPNLGTPVRRGASGTLPFSFLVRPAPGRALPEALLTLTGAEGTPVFQSPLLLPRPDSTGRIRVVSALKLGDLAAGPYVLRVTVRQGDAEQVRETTFELTD